MRARSMGLLLAAAIGIGCGDDGDASSASGATSGGPGSGGAGGAGGMTGAGGAGTGGAGSGCAPGADCGPGLYCDAPGCGMGTCQPTPNPATLPPGEAPVCGCDGITYWNEGVAAWHGVATQSAGECAAGTPCGQGTPCPGGLHCYREAASAAACSNALPGTCWGMPLSCDLAGPKARACIGATCELKCSLIQSQNPWYADPTCI